MAVVHFDVYRALHEYLAMFEENVAAMDDTIREPRVIERKRLWEHGEGGKGDGCERRHKPVYTPPEDAPRICRQWDCDNEHWYAKGYVQRDKNTKQIVVRESPDGRQEKVI